MKQKFRDINFKPKTLALIEKVNEVLADYKRQGYVLTLRQLYYRLVTLNLIENSKKSYKRFSTVIKDGRLCGLIDWNGIEDRLRKIRRLPSWDTPKEIIESCIQQFRYPKHEGQLNHVEVWVEKDALSEIVQRAANQYQVPVMVNRGYGSASMMYDAYKRLESKLHDGAEKIVILYLGDHDPSGLDMVRDIYDRLHEMLYCGSGIEYVLTVKHIGITMQQINQYNPPPNPAKVDDPRAKWYIEHFGYVSWEVDALEPSVLTDLIHKHILDSIDIDLWNDNVKKENEAKRVIEKLMEIGQNDLNKTIHD